MHGCEGTRRETTEVADEGAARRALDAAPRRFLPGQRRRRDTGSAKESAVARAIRPETRFGKNRVSLATDGWHPPDARERGRGEERASRNRLRKHRL